MAAWIGVGTIIPACLRTASSSATTADRQRRSLRDSRPATRSSTASGWRAGRCGRRRTPRVQHRHRNRVRIPAEAEVALVGGDQRTPAPRPLHDLAQVLDAEHRTRRIAREFTKISLGTRGPSWVSESAATTSAPARRAPDVVGQVRQLRHHDHVVTGNAEQRRQPGDELLGTDDRQHGVRVEVGDP